MAAAAAAVAVAEAVAEAVAVAAVDQSREPMSTIGVGRECAEARPNLFAAVTTTRIR